MDINKLRNRALSAGFFLIACSAIATLSPAQSPVPSPSPSSEEPEGPYTITSSIELGVRGIEVNGDHEKYRSDLNYRAGFRVFDSSFLIKDNTEGIRLFDTALFTSSGWGSDPSGSFRANLDKAGIYKFESNVRRVKYFNSLNKFAFNQHNFNILHHFGDFDLTIFPERDLRFRLGYSFNNTEGPGTNNIRFPSFSSSLPNPVTIRGDEFQVNSSIESRSQDLRFGIEGKLLGFNAGLNYGHRVFRDETRFFLDTFSLGNDPSSINTNATLNRMTRDYPTRGTTDYIHFFTQRTFANKVDFAGRFIYAESRTSFEQTDIASGTSNNPFFVDLDQIRFTGDAKRPQTRADVGATWRVTDDFRISNTFTFDQFNIGGGTFLFELLKTRTFPAGVARNDDISSTLAWRATSYRRFSNMIEADYQFGRWLAVNFGYRYTNRAVHLAGFDRNALTGALASNSPRAEEEENQTHTIIAGTRIKPTKNWSIFADVERGESDNVFTRLANNDFINFRIRNRVNFKQFTANVSLVTKDNDSPGTTCSQITCPGAPSGLPAPFESTAMQKSRYFSASLDWNPFADYSISGGYTYNFQDSKIDVIVPVGSPIFSPTRFLIGSSEYFVRESFFHVDVSARPVRWLSAYVSYRINDDRGQGDRVVTRPQDIITSYPIRFQTPEVKLAFRITKNIDWNVGYQYYDYKERPVDLSFLHQPFVAENYSAHLLYTSLRFYFGRPAGDR